MVMEAVVEVGEESLQFWEERFQGLGVHTESPKPMVAPGVSHIPPAKGRQSSAL